jgi:hypothetical protein
MNFPTNKSYLRILLTGVLILTIALVYPPPVKALCAISVQSTFDFLKTITVAPIFMVNLVILSAYFLANRNHPRIKKISKPSKLIYLVGMSALGALMVAPSMYLGFIFHNILTGLQPVLNGYTSPAATVFVSTIFYLANIYTATTISLPSNIYQLRKISRLTLALSPIIVFGAVLTLYLILSNISSRAYAAQNPSEPIQLIPNGTFADKCPPPVQTTEYEYLVWFLAAYFTSMIVRISWRKPHNRQG